MNTSWDAPRADQGVHVFCTSVSIAPDVLGAAEAGYRLNLPLREASGAAVAPVVTSENPAIVVEAAKLAEDRSGDVIVRLYEARGSKTTGSVAFGFPFAEVTETDILERASRRLAIDSTSEDGVRLTLRAFQLVTLRIARR